MPPKKPKKEEPKEKSQKEIDYENLSNFLDKYISSEKLITKYATLFDLRRIKYVKGKDLKQFFNDNFEEIQKEMLSIMKIDIGKEADKESLQKFYQIIQQNNIFHYLQKLPGDKAKYPKRLLPLQKGDDPKLELEFTDTGFYLIAIKTESSKKPVIYLILLIILILFIVLFPIWPLNVKLGVLYFLMAVLIFMIVFLFSTIIIQILGLLIGYDILIMPNIDEAKMSWKNRLFNPFIIINSREDPCSVKIIRILLLISLTALCVLAYLYPSIPKASFHMIKKGLLWIFDYGKEKIEDIHYHRNSMKVKNGPYLDDIDNL